MVSHQDRHGWPERDHTDGHSCGIESAAITTKDWCNPVHHQDASATRRVRVTEADDSETPTVSASLSRRRLLLGIAVGGVAAIAGCLEDDDDAVDDPTPDGADPTPTPDDAQTPTPEDVPPGEDEPTPTPEEDVAGELEIEREITSMVNEIYVRQETEAGEVEMEAEMEYHWDFENQRVKQVFNMITEGVTYEIYHIDETMYQVFDEMCTQVEDVPMEFDDEFTVQDPDDLDDTHLYTHDGTGEFRGMTVDVWSLDVDASPWAEEGWFSIYLDPDTNHMVGIGGELHYESPDGVGRTQFIEQYFHSHNEDLDIEVPDVCENGGVGG